MAPKRYQSHNSASRLKTEHIFVSLNHITPLPTQRYRELSELWEKVDQWQGGLEEGAQLQEKELGDATTFLHPSGRGVTLFSWTTACPKPPCSPDLVCPLISPRPPLTPESPTEASSIPQTPKPSSTSKPPQPWHPCSPETLPHLQRPRQPPECSPPPHPHQSALIPIIPKHLH